MKLLISGIQSRQKEQEQKGIYFQQLFENNLSTEIPYVPLRVPRGNKGNEEYFYSVPKSLKMITDEHNQSYLMAITKRELVTIPFKKVLEHLKKHNRSENIIELKDLDYHIQNITQFGIEERESIDGSVIYSQGKLYWNIKDEQGLKLVCSEGINNEFKEVKYLNPSDLELQQFNSKLVVVANRHLIYNEGIVKRFDAQINSIRSDGKIILLSDNNNDSYLISQEQQEPFPINREMIGKVESIALKDIGKNQYLAIFSHPKADLTFVNFDSKYAITEKSINLLGMIEDYIKEKKETGKISEEESLSLEETLRKAGTMGHLNKVRNIEVTSNNHVLFSYYKIIFYTHANQIKQFLNGQTSNLKIKGHHLLPHRVISTEIFED